MFHVRGKVSGSFAITHSIDSQQQIQQSIIPAVTVRRADVVQLPSSLAAVHRYSPLWLDDTFINCTSQHIIQKLSAGLLSAYLPTTWGDFCSEIFYKPHLLMTIKCVQILVIFLQITRFTQSTASKSVRDKKWTNCEHYHGIREWHKTTWPLAEVQNISQGSVVTRSRCAGIFNDDLITSWNDGKRIMKTAQHLTSYRQEHLHLFWPRVANGPITPITAMTLRWKCQRCWCFPNSSSISW